MGYSAPAALAVLMAGQVSLPTAVTFTDRTREAGITFAHHSGATGRFWYPELFGSGVAVLDIDGDLWPDLLFVDGRERRAGAEPSRPALYRNNRNGTFTDLIRGSGLDAANLDAMGAAVADYDNDGREDVFITTVDGGRLFRNLGDRRFSDTTAAAGIQNSDFTVAAAWLDYDRDGRADLFIGNYVKWSPEAEVRCALNGVAGYCGPDSYKPVAPKLFRNLGNGRFENVTAKAGLDHPTDKAMGVAVLDYNADGWPDIFIGSDRVPAKLYRNDTRGAFVDEGVAAGVALSENGAARANMGVDAADYDRSGRPHLAVGNFINEMLGLYRNENGRAFVDVAPRSAVGRASLLSVTWAVFFLDYDLDGFLDLFAANGGTDESQGRDVRATIDQPPLMLRNLGNGSFAATTSALGPAFSRPAKARGAAYADIDGDGDLDIVTTTHNGPAHLFRNDGGNRHNWLRVRTVGSASNRSGLGTVVRVTSDSGEQWQSVHSGSSYASQSELTLTFGLGTDRGVSRVEVIWPSGTRQVLSAVGINRLLVVDEARGVISGPPGGPSTGAAIPPR